MGAPEPRRGAGGLVVLRPSLKRVVPGSVPPWRAPCFAWPCRGFGLPGVFSWLCHGFLLPAARNHGAASEVASRSAIARLTFPYYSSRYKNLLVKLFLQVETRSSGRRRSPAARGFSSTFLSLSLSARLRAVEMAFFASQEPNQTSQEPNQTSQKASQEPSQTSQKASQTSQKASQEPNQTSQKASQKPSQASQKPTKKSQPGFPLRALALQKRSCWAFCQTAYLGVSILQPHACTQRFRLRILRRTRSNAGRVLGASQVEYKPFGKPL